MDNNHVIFSLANTQLANALIEKLGFVHGSIEIREFPDGESYIRIDTDVKDKNVLLVCGLDHPNDKFLPLLFTAKTMRELGACKICLIAPYLPYMRQDKRFHPGEAMTSTLFAKSISELFDCLITFDPHLHRIHHLSDIYSISTIKTLHAVKDIAQWVQKNISSPCIIGPDEESEQWVSDIASRINVPYFIIKKTRFGDREIAIKMPDINDNTMTPVLVDDIISTGTSMCAALQELIAKGFKHPVCVAVHALFDKQAYQNLIKAGASEIITCNTIPHPTNKIDITNTIIESIKELQ